jgi:uncharacterized protein YjbI with pentapeptide repeats
VVAKDLLKAARSGTTALEEWQARHQRSWLDLSGADLSGCDLRWMNFAGANLSNVNFADARLTGAYFGPARFRAEASQVETEDTPVNLSGTSFKGATLLAATFNYPAIRSANFGGAFLGLANFRNVIFEDNSFSETQLTNTAFAACNMNGIGELESAVHLGPSHLDMVTLQQSTALTAAFFRQVGLSDLVISYLPSLADTERAINFYSCFLSHSTEDKRFCDLLYKRLVSEHVRIWYAPADMRGGDRMVSQINRAINLHDKMIVVLSEASIGSQWVANEIRWARRREQSTGIQALFPIRLVSLEALRDWELIDPETGVDLAADVRGYFVPDFTEWDNRQRFEEQLVALLRDLRADTKMPKRSGADTRSRPNRAASEK